MASKLGGQNVRNDNGCEKSPRSEVAERTILWSPTRSRFSGKADVVREETSKCTSQDRRGTGPSIQEKIRRSNVGKGHLPAGTGNNLRRPIALGTTEGERRILVWPMSPYERRKPGNAG